MSTLPRIVIVDGPVPEDFAFGAAAASESDEVGAELVFDGIVRRMEADRPLRALSYEVYSPMAERAIEELARAMIAKHTLASLDVVHSRGLVPVGERSMRVVVRAAHRGESLAATGEFIDRLKKDVPIWKLPVWG